MSRNVVDLPQPDGPSSTLSVPESSANEISSTARICPATVVQCLLIFSTAIADTAPPMAAPDDDGHSARPGMIAKGAGSSRRSCWLSKQGRERRARVGGAHERFAHEK